MDMLDSLAFVGLDWVYDKVEERYGKAAAWVVTTVLAFSILAAMLTVGVTFFRWLYS